MAKMFSAKGRVDLLHSKGRLRTACTAGQTCHNFNFITMEAAPCFGRKLTMNFVAARQSYQHRDGHVGKPVTRHWCRHCNVSLVVVVLPHDLILCF